MDDLQGSDGTAVRTDAAFLAACTEVEVRIDERQGGARTDGDTRSAITAEGSIYAEHA
jgi:hypothetical protein